MPRRLWLSLALLATGTALLATARLAGASPPSPAIFRVGFAGASVQIDPQVSYISTGWWLEYATAAKLYNWTDRGSKLVPEVASRLTVSNGGRTYTFLLRRSFRFSDGSRVTARNFAYAFKRARSRNLASPAEQFLLGVRSVQAKRPYKLVIRLAKPDQEFIAKLSMPFFQATSTSLPLTREVVGPYPTAGPYYFAGNQVNTLTAIRPNPFYRGGRPQNLAGLDVRWNLNEADAFHQVEANELDEGPLPEADAQGVVDRYGVNKTRFWSKPGNCVGLLAVNGFKPPFRRLAMRKALNWAVDRADYARLAGVALATPWTHILPPNFRGSITKKRSQPYSVHANLAKARRLVGDLSGQKITVGYRSSGIGPAQAELVRQSLIRLGFRPENITMKAFSGGNLYAAMGTRGSDIDLGVPLAWCSDVPDPYDLLSFLFPPWNTVTTARYGAKLAAANRLRGHARVRALGKLDLEITRNVVPAAFMRTYNNRYFFSRRVDQRSLVYSRIYQDWSIPALTLK